jgi:hypothetical protein
MDGRLPWTGASGCLSPCSMSLPVIRTASVTVPFRIGPAAVPYSPVGPTMGRLYPSLSPAGSVMGQVFSAEDMERRMRMRRRQAERVLRSVELRDGCADPETPGPVLEGWLVVLECCPVATREGKLWRRRVESLLQNPNMPLGVLRSVRGFHGEDGSIRAWSSSLEALRDAVLENPLWSLAAMGDPDVLLEPQRTRATTSRHAPTLRALLGSEDAETRRRALNNERLPRAALDHFLREAPWEEVERATGGRHHGFSYAAVRGRDGLLLRALAEDEPDRIARFAWCAESCQKRAFWEALRWIMRQQGAIDMVARMKVAPVSQLRAYMQGSPMPETTARAIAAIGVAAFHNPLMPPERIAQQAVLIKDTVDAGVCDTEERRYWASILAENPSAPPRALRLCWFLGERDALRKPQFPPSLVRVLVLHAPRTGRRRFVNVSPAAKIAALSDPSLSLLLWMRRRAAAQYSPQGDKRRSRVGLPLRRRRTVPPRWGRRFEGYVSWAQPDHAVKVSLARTHIILGHQAETADVQAARAARDKGESELTRFDWPFVSRFNKKAQRRPTCSMSYSR